MPDEAGQYFTLTLKEAGERSGLSPATLRSQIRHGRIVADKRGRDLFVRWADIESYLASRSPRGRYRKDIKPENAAS